MSPFDAKEALHAKKFFRFTGPPENWLTAIKYMTWGLEEKYLERWKQISVGDVFLMHSTTDSLYKRSQSTIVGIGVVSGDFKRKDDFLWIQEMRGQKNIWPLLVPFSEVYLFSPLPPVQSWEAPGIGSEEGTQKLIDQLLIHAILLNSIGDSEHRFPVMGSWSSVRNELVDNLFTKASPMLYHEFYTESELKEQTSTDFLPATKAEESMRYVPTLKFLDGAGVRVKKQSGETSIFERDNALLDRAEEGHRNVLQMAIDFFRKEGFDTWSNQHVDLLAEAGDRAYLVEVKSTLNHNFRPQARRAIGQLFEYEYFDVRKHFERHDKSPRLAKVLMVSDNPQDVDYSSLLHSMKVHLSWPTGSHIKAYTAANKLVSLLEVA